MEIFQLYNNQILSLEEEKFKLEKEIQHLFEKNLNFLTWLEFIKSEFAIQNQRFDTLAYDNENNAFVIIEYKRNQNYSVFDQWISYLNTLLKFKSDFIVEYNETLRKNLKRDEVDWSQSRVIFVAPHFNEFQKQAVDFKDLNIDLLEVKKFKKDILVINNIKKSISSPWFWEISSNKINSNNIERIKEIKTYTEDYHLNWKSDEIIGLFEDFKNAILNLSSEINIEPKKLYIAFKENKKTISDIEIQKKQLKIHINKKAWELKDEKRIAKDVSNMWHWWNWDYVLLVNNTDNLEYIMSLIKQVL